MFMFVQHVRANVSVRVGGNVADGFGSHDISGDGVVEYVSFVEASVGWFGPGGLGAVD